MPWIREKLGLEDPTYDEYGIQKPSRSWLETFTDPLMDPEGDDAWYTQLGKGLAAIPASLGGHMLDNLPLIGGPGIGPLNELHHGAEQNHYQQERAAAEQRALEETEKRMFPEAPEVTPDNGGECTPYDAMY